jgi:hypothetical protein
MQKRKGTRRQIDNWTERVRDAEAKGQRNEARRNLGQGGNIMD